ncbi:MAG TPA: phenylalanine--tRNA ligase subunit beta [Magnetospirillaceae bacterium]|nr:phenylalanine--tRNA ligase subunit beta [Magnetospirillaceae bacterium]
MKRYSDKEQWKLPLAALVDKIGAQLGAVEEVVDLSHKYDGVFVADIVTAREHPRADKLGVYALNIGAEVVQVIAGDKLLNVGDKVGWIQPGATTPATWGTVEPFIIGAREMRGEVSHGMLGSGKELGLSDDHTRVQVLDTDAPAGTPFADVYDFAGDAIIDIENKMFTHRPDGFGQLGVAREIAGIQGLSFASPDWYSADAQLPEAQSPLTIHIKNEIPKLVPRFTALVIDGIKISSSPLWLQATLSKLGIRPINTVVDITNYYMVLTGQPLHAYDYNKVKTIAGSAALTVRHPKQGEKITLLSGKEITPHPDTMMVAAGDTLLCVGGMIGGANSEVDATTTAIILEAASWDMFSIRRTSMHHGIFTDAVTRFSKGQSPLQNVAVLAKAAPDIIELAGGAFGHSADVMHLPDGTLERASVHPPVVLTQDFVNSRLGSKLHTADIATLLRNVEFRVEEHGTELVVTPPFWRTDVAIPEDVIEEVGRLCGYDQLTHNLPLRETIAVSQPRLDGLKNRVRDILSRAGANELQTYSFVPARLLQVAGQDKASAFAIRNALSPELQHYRLSLTPSLLEKVHPNIKAGYKQFGLFEINKIHIKDDVAVDCDGLPREYQTIAFVFASQDALAGASYYHAKHYLGYMLGTLGIPYTIVPADTTPGFAVGRQVFAPFEPKRSGFVYVGDGEFAGFVGEYRASVAKALKLPAVTAGFEIDIERLLKYQKITQYKPLLKFPQTEQDVCLRVAKAVNFADLQKLIEDAFIGDKRLRLTVEPLDIYERPGDTDHKQITFRLTLQHHDRTLTTTETNDMLDTMVQKVNAVTPAERI